VPLLRPSFLEPVVPSPIRRWSITLNGTCRLCQYLRLKDRLNLPIDGLRRAAWSCSAASATHAGARAPRHDGTRSYRTFAAVTGCSGRSTRNSPDANSKILELISPCDSPRTGTRPSAPGCIAAPRGCASGEPARGGGIGPAHCRGSAGWPATMTIGGPLADRRGCNIASADAVAGTAARSLSTDRAAADNKLGLAWEMNGDILELGPREVLLPKVKPRREALTSHRGAFMRCNLLPARFRADRTTLSLKT
jgi:hypothetical protein